MSEAIVHAVKQDTGT